MFAAISAAAAQDSPLTRAVRGSVAAKLDRIEKDGDFAEGQVALQELFDQTMAFGSKDDLEAFREAAFALRLVGQLQVAPADKRLGLLKYLRANDALAREIVFSMSSKNRVGDVYALLDRLRQERGERVTQYANLAAAICLVHDRPFERKFLEYTLHAVDPLQIFDYFVANDAKLVHSVRDQPVELLMYVVDTTADIDEMNWAMVRYAGTRLVGKLFFQVEYDWANWETGVPKKINAVKYGLPALLKYGGVCGDQAYFAVGVGKAIGVPTAMVHSESAESEHYWCYFFEFKGKASTWNFDEARYDSYMNIKGAVVDPQTREQIPDTYVALLAELVNTTPQARESGRALADAALRMMELEKRSQGLPTAPPAGTGDNLRARKVGIEAELELIDLAVHESSRDRYCWEPLRQLAAGGKLTTEMKRDWSDALVKACGKKYPDFALAMLTPMVKTVPDLAEQEGIWDWVYDMVKARSDLAAEVRMQQAAVCEATGRPEKAQTYYKEVIDRYANSGPFVIDALDKAAKVLRASNQRGKALKLYEDTWAHIEPPREIIGPFESQSNWYKVGQTLISLLDEAGEKAKAQKVRDALAGKDIDR
jgi:hypothetical protein